MLVVFMQMIIGLDPATWKYVHAAGKGSFAGPSEHEYFKVAHRLPHNDYGGGWTDGLYPGH